MNPMKLIGAGLALVFIISALPLPVRAADITSNLVLHYSFDNPANLGADSSGNGYNGLLAGTTTPTAATSSVKGGAAFFNKTGYSSIIAPSQAKIGASYTKSAWAYISTNASSGAGIISHPTKISKQHVLMQYSTATIWSSHSHSLAENRVVGTVTRNKWSHIVTTYDAATLTLKLYIDGALVGTLQNVPAVPEAEREIMVGAYATNGVSRTFDGPLDEVRVYDRALIAEEVAYLRDYDLQTVTSPSQSAPTATNVQISGTLKEGETLTGTYAYVDAENDAESGSTYRWLSHDSGSAQGTPIAGATSLTYVPTASEAGKYVSFEVLPRAATGTTQGVAAASAPVFVEAKPVIPDVPETVPDVVTGLTLYYSFDDAADLGKDSSGNGYHGVLGGTTLPTVSSNAVRGTAAFFNRAGFSRITPPSTAQLGGSYTKAAWAYVTQTGGSTGGGLISHPTKASAMHTLMQYSTNTIQGANSYGAIKVADTVTKNVWTHVVLTYDETTQVLSLYKNGVLSASISNVAPVKSTDRALLIGSMADAGSTRTFDGPLDEVRVYSRALTPAEIAYLYNSDRTTVEAPSPVTAKAFPNRVQLSFPAIVDASDYRIDYAPSSGTSFTTFADGVNAITNPIVTGLSTGTAYKFRVKALKNGIWGPYSSIVYATPGSSPETAPYAENVSMLGNPVEGQTLTGTYSYLDVNDDPESGSTYRWLKSTSPTGPYTAIAGATGITYTVTQSDGNRYIAFEVTPKAASGIAVGAAVRSAGRQASAAPRFYHVLATGQSLSVGGGPMSLTQPYQNLMLSSARDADGNAYDVGPFIPLKAISSEKIDIPASNTYAGFMHEAGTDVVVVSTAHGVGGQAYEFIKKGTAPYNRGIGQATLTKQLAEQAGGEYIPLAITLVHGEYDSLYNNTNYDNNIEELRTDYQNDVSALVGHPVTLPLFFSQTSQTSPHRAALLQLKAHRNNANDYLTGPIYQYEYNNPGYLHLTGAGSRDLGEQVGKVMYEVLALGHDWSPLMPTEITRSGREVLVKYHVPAPPITFDTQQVAERASKGFMYWKNGEQLPIESVEIVGTDTIKITLVSVPTGTALEEVSYAINPAYGTRHYGDALDPLAYGGNVRDSDTRVAPGSTSSGKPLYNWAVAFRDPVIVQ